MSRLELRLLGPPELHLNGQRLALPTRKLLALVAYLALQGPTSRARLADLFWSESPENSARGNLRRELNRLRHTPLGQKLQAEGEWLCLREVWCDATEFWTHLGAGRLEEALALYRGALLEGLELAGAIGFEEWLEGERERLAQARREALVRRAEGLEAAGDLREALKARLELLREDELQELHHREAMRLHALLGEREAALRRFEELKGLLKRELGLEPLPETLRLAERIRASGSQEAPAVEERPASIPAIALHPPLVGREREWERMEAAWQAKKALYLSGPPGVGKTRLMLEFAQRKGPFILLQGRPSDAGIPYAFHTRAIRQSLARFPDLELPPWVRREISRLIPELESEPPLPITSEEGKLRLLEAITEVIRALSQRGVTTVVADDLQFVSDAASYEVAAYAMTRLLPEGMFHSLNAFRREELDPLILKAIRQQVERGQAVWIELEPLSETDLLRMVRLMSGSGGAARFTQRLYKATGGNPLFVLETLKALFEAGELRVGADGWHTPYDQVTADYRELPIPASVREAVTRRLDHLGEDIRRLLEAASLAGDSFTLEELEGATALSEWESLLALERALQAGLLEREGARYRFHHELVHRSVVLGLGPERKRLLHLKLAANLERLDAPPAQIALHLEQAGKAKEAIPWRIRSAEAAVRVYAHAEALEHYERALLDGPEEEEAFALRKGRARILASLDERKAWEEEISALRALAVASGRPELAAEASLEWAQFYNGSGRYAEALEEAEKALTSPSLAARAHHQAGLALVSLGRLAEAEERLRLALQAPPLEGTPERGQIHFALCNCALQRGDLEGAARQVAEALDHFRRAGHRRGEVEAQARKGLILGLAGQTSEAIDLLTLAAAQAQEMGERPLERVTRLNLFKFLFESGQLEAALPHLERGLELAREPQDPRIAGLFLNNLGVVHRARGELGRALECFREALEVAERAGIAQYRVWRRLTLAENYLDLGSPALARPLLEAAGKLAEESGLGEVEAWRLALLARCELMEGHPEAVPPMLAPLLEAELADHNDRARAAWLLGAAWLRQGEPEKALQVTAGLEALPAFQVRLMAVALEARLFLGQPGDLEAAQGLLEDPGVALLESFDLRRVLLRALRAAGQSEAATRLARDSARRLAQIAATLRADPELQHSFLSLYQDLLG